MQYTTVSRAIKGRNYELIVVAQAGGLDLTLKSDFVLSQIRDTLPFGQVPYLIDGEVKLAQSQAILRYLAKKGGIQGATDAEFANSEMLIEETRDILALMETAVGSATKNTTYDELFSETGAMYAKSFCVNYFIADQLSLTFYFTSYDQHKAAGLSREDVCI